MKHSKYNGRYTKQFIKKQFGISPSSYSETILKSLGRSITIKPIDQGFRFRILTN